MKIAVESRASPSWPQRYGAADERDADLISESRRAEGGVAGGTETARRGEQRGRRRDPIRVGVIGSGSVAQKYIPHMQRMNIPRQRVDIAVVCDPDERQSGRCQGALRTRHVHYRTTGTSLADPSIDLVLVLTSMQQHGEIARAALEAGKHVLVEKPMAMTLPEAAELVEPRGAESRLSRLRSARRPQPDLSGDLAAPRIRAPSAQSSARAASTAGPVRAGGNGSIDPAAGRCSTSASTTSPPSPVSSVRRGG